MEFYSHIYKYDNKTIVKKPLVKHLIEVNNQNKDEFEGKEKRAMDIICCSHDFGKYTTYFQEHLLYNKKSTPLSEHSFISALAAAYIAIREFGEEDILPLSIYNIVLYHHGSFKNYDYKTPKTRSKFDKGIDKNVTKQMLDIVFKQIEDIEKNKEDIINDYEILGYSDEIKDFVENKPIKEILKKLNSMYIKNIKNNDTSTIYFDTLKFYSHLISADKFSAANIDPPKIKYISYDKLNKVKEDKIKGAKGEINKIRSEIFGKIQESIEENYNTSKIFSITSPTGTGKTYSGFFAALKLKELLGEDAKIIYSLPFTSIINQNFDSIKNLFRDVKDFQKNSSSYLLMHHSYANAEFKSEKEEYDKAQSEMLFEVWSSGIVITTFVQLLETLIGNRNRMLKKFHSIKGSIILLDEVQAIPTEYYELVDYVLKEASEKLDCRVIMMTATRPMMLIDAVELLKGNENYFRLFNRTKLIPKLNNVSIDEFIEEFIVGIEEKSYLIICNTITQSLDIYNKLEGLNREVLYLSTNLLPIHRRAVIDEVTEKLKNNKKIILVSTQVVEAGVDFDFDVVIRDLAPLDSIIQAAGRCNRNAGDNKVGEVYIRSFVDKRGRLYGRTIYGNTSINVCKEILEKYEEVEEKDYFKLINEYSTKIIKEKNTDASPEFIKSIKNLYFNKAPKEEYSIGKFSLIEEKNNNMDVFIIYDDEAEEVYAEMLRGFGEKDKNKKNQIFISIKNKVRDYTLSLPNKYYTKFDTDAMVINLPREGCRDYYNEKIGFIRDDKDEFMMF
ncbi:CRISPR-associated helicase Cas3' [Clostridium sp. DL1XJH146]